ncbi:MAG: hypothetical protein ISS93_00535 [Candidatus Aenigmarchaeota archaeon]|nr:hypothetical protein [Candidatus Aenigmarchaeota archaeon]
MYMEKRHTSRYCNTSGGSYPGRTSNLYDPVLEPIGRGSSSSPSAPMQNIKRFRL